MMRCGMAVYSAEARSGLDGMDEAVRSDHPLVWVKSWGEGKCSMARIGTVRQRGGKVRRYPEVIVELR